MKLPRVMEITTLSRSTIYSWIKAGSFPAPVKLGPRSVTWLKEEVDNWPPESRKRASTPVMTRRATTNDALSVRQRRAATSEVTRDRLEAAGTILDAAWRKVRCFPVPAASTISP
jgi:prophage regulatory protein